MGGFFLVGPNYVFRTKLEEDDEECLCPPFSRLIDEDLENKLIQKSEKILDINDFSLHLRLAFVEEDGDNEGMHYEILDRKDFTRDVEYIERQDRWFERSLLD